METLIEIILVFFIIGVAIAALHDGYHDNTVRYAEMSLRHTQEVERLKRTHTYFEYSLMELALETPPVFLTKTTLRPRLTFEAREWCETNCAEMPETKELDDQFFLFFAEPNDAFAFKMRWL